MVDTASTQPTKDPRRTGFIFSRPMIVSVLYIANFFLGFTILIGLVLAYVWRADGDSEEWEMTHFDYTIHTFWLTLGWFLLILSGWIAGAAATSGLAGIGREPGLLFPLLLILGPLAWLALFVYYCVRCVMALTKAAAGKPMPKPTSWTI